MTYCTDAANQIVGRGRMRLMIATAASTDRVRSQLRSDDGEKPLL